MGDLKVSNTGTEYTLCALDGIIFLQIILSIGCVTDIKMLISGRYKL
jgi:hypothetical protein